jgi:hypothetical protein
MIDKELLPDYKCDVIVRSRVRKNINGGRIRACGYKASLPLYQLPDGI